MATPKLKTKACETCGGSGAVPADNVGPLLREEREAAGIASGDVADAMSISRSFLYDLEKGNRRMTNELLASYQRALEELSSEQPA